MLPIEFRRVIVKDTLEDVCTMKMKNTLYKIYMLYIYTYINIYMRVYIYYIHTHMHKYPPSI